jgi:hypothetical protein
MRSYSSISKNGVGFNQMFCSKTTVLVPALLLGVLGLLAGCTKAPSNPKTFAVDGVLSLDDKPIEGATIVLVPISKDDGEAASGVSDATGKFSLTTYTSGDGVRPGSYRIRVTKFDKVLVDDSKRVRNMTPEEEMKAYDPDAKPPTPPKNLLPKKYETEMTSGFSHQVKDSPSKLELKLSSK